MNLTGNPTGNPKGTPKRIHILFLILLLLLFSQLILLVPGTLNDEIKESNEVKPVGGARADQSMEKVHLLEGQGGRKEWELFSQTAEGFIGKGRWQLTDVRALFYTLTGEKYTVVGKSGSIDSTTKDITIDGDVTMRSTNGYEFAAPSIEYFSKDKRLVSKSRVAMKGPKDQERNRLILSGSSMTTNLDTSFMEISGSVSAIRRLSSGKEVSIESEKAQFSGRSNLARFYQNVLMNYQTMKLRGPEALISMDPKTQVPHEILVNGGVSALDQDRTATAERIQIDLLENKYVLKGTPRVVQNGDELTGDQITFLDGGKRVKIDNVKARVEDVKEKRE